MKIEAIQVGEFLKPGGVRLGAMSVFQKCFPAVEVESFNQSGPGQSQAHATIKGHRVTVVTLPDRIDLHVHAANGGGPGEGDVDIIFFKEDCLKRFAEFAATNDPIRLSLVANATTNVDSSEDAIAIFKSRCESVPIPSGTDEVEFKINVPRPSSKSEDLMINVIHRLYSGIAVMMMVGPSGQIVQQGAQPQLNEQLDVNTVVGQTIPAGKVSDLYEELASIAFEQIGKDPTKLESGRA